MQFVDVVRRDLSASPWRAALILEYKCSQRVSEMSGCNFMVSIFLETVLQLYEYRSVNGLTTGAI